MEYVCVVHKKSVEFELNNSSKELRERAKLVNDTIECLINKHPHVILMNDDPRKIPKFITSNDKVVLCGAYHGNCLSAAQISFTIKNIPAKYYKGGYI